MAFNIAYLARESTKTYPDKPALIFDGGVLTFGQVEALSDQPAPSLRSQLLVRGDRVGLQLPNIPQIAADSLNDRVAET